MKMGIFDWLIKANINKRKEKASFRELIKPLKNKDWRVRVSAARALGETGDTKAVEPLRDALKDKEVTVRVAAREALDKLGWKPGEEMKKAPNEFTDTLTEADQTLETLLRELPPTKGFTKVLSADQNTNRHRAWLQINYEEIVRYLRSCDASKYAKISTIWVPSTFEWIDLPNRTDAVRIIVKQSIIVGNSMVLEPNTEVSIIKDENNNYYVRREGRSEGLGRKAWI